MIVEILGVTQRASEIVMETMAARSGVEFDVSFTDW